MKSIDTLVSKAVADRVFPGAYICVGRGDDRLYQKGFGFLDYEKRAPVHEQTLYDVASLTKVMVTGVLIAQALSEKKLSLDFSIDQFLPEVHQVFNLRHLLTHSSGLPAWRPYYESMKKNLGHAAANAIMLQNIAKETLNHPPGTHTEYSDLGFILLGILLEKIYGKELSELSHKKIFKPLGLMKTGFNPEVAHSLENVAPTENCPYRQMLVRGEVHDLNAWAMKGIAGHAGIFSTGPEVGIFAEAILKNLRGQDVLLPAATLRQFMQPQNLPRPSTWALAWDTPSPENSSAGSLWSKQAIGHLGFTGCSLWLDLKHALYAVCLSNRVHPEAKNDKIKSFRPLLHDAIIRAFCV